MKTAIGFRRSFLLGLFAFLAAAPSFGRGAPDDLKPLIGRAVQYALPLYEMIRIQDACVFYPASLIHMEPNRLYHTRTLASQQTPHLITGPNPDTLYSIAFADLRGGPVQIDVPEMADRYYSIALVDEYTNNFAYIGRRTTGTRAGSYLLVSPHDTGSSREGLTVFRAPTEDVMVLLRIVVDGPEDLETVHHLQDGFTLVPRGTPPGAPLDSRHRYRLHLPADMPVDGFWSLSVHQRFKEGSFFVDNPIHRWSIGDRTPGLRRNADGSFDILIQRDAPEEGWKSNWLPLPGAPFRLTLRNYQPRPALLDGSFRHPAVEQLD